MSESLDQIQAKALRMLLRVYGQALDRKNPLLELIVNSLSHPTGGLKPFPGMDLDPVNFNRFLQLAFEGPEGVTRSVYQIMVAEQSPVPDQPDKLPDWAEDLMLLLLEARGLVAPVEVVTKKLR